MAQITIKRGAGTTVLAVTIDDNSRLFKQLNGQDTINLSFVLDSYTQFLVGDYVTWRGVNYKIYQVPGEKKHSLVKYEYNLVFEGLQYALLHAIFLLDGQGEFYLTGMATDFISLIITNMNRLNPSVYSVGTIPTTDYRNLNFDNINCLQALQRIADEFDYEFIVDDGVISLSQSIGNATGLTFEYHDGLKNIKRTKVGDKNIITRVYPFGSGRNLDYNYGAKRLKIADGYVEQNTGTYGVIESIKVFEDIYPHFTGVVDSSSAVNTIVDAAIDFDLNYYLIEGETAKIVFLTGDLSGYEFEITSYVHATKTIIFKSYTPEDGLTLPTATIKPEAGDKFTFVDIKMPAAYITAAEGELLTAANAYLAEVSNPNVIYEIEMDGHNLKENSISIEVGDSIAINDTQLTDGPVDLRVLEFSQSLADAYKYSVKIGQFILLNYFQKIESVQDLGTIPTKKQEGPCSLQGSFRTWYMTWTGTLIPETSNPCQLKQE